MDEDLRREFQDAWVLSVLGVPVDRAGSINLDVDAVPEPGSDEYRKYLLRRLKHVRAAGQANFGIVLGETGPEHRMALHHSAGPRMLATKLMQTTGLHRVTWGTASPDPDKPATLRIAIEGRALPGLCKQGNRMLRAFKPLPFARMVLWMDGNEVESPDDGDGAEERPVSVLPDIPAFSTPQSEALQRAARRHVGLCEECLPA